MLCGVPETASFGRPKFGEPAPQRQEGKVGEKLEDVESYLGRGLVGVEATEEVLADVRLSSAACGVRQWRWGSSGGAAAR